ncbi:MAG: TRAP transporter small permease [Alphaproteobacteria bacterium]|nr:TRAP transporter small permease [Alphaproteobacteria bacterium]
MVALIERLSFVAGVIAALLIAVAIGIVCQMVFIRYVLVESAAWQTEVVTFSLVAATLLGSPWVMKERGHVSVALVTEYSPPGARRMMAILADCVVLIFAGIMTWKGFLLTMEAFHGSWTTDSIYEFPLWIPYSSVPIGFGLLALQSIACLIKVVQGKDQTGARGH